MQTSTDEITAALDANDFVLAEGLSRQRLATSPDDGFALSALGRILERRGEVEEAERLLGHPQALAAHAAGYELLASVQYRLSAFDRCEATLSARAARKPPMAAEYYRLLIKLKRARGADAGKDLADALLFHPDNLELITIHIEVLFAADPASAFQEIERTAERLSSTPGALAVLLKRRTVLRTRLLTREQGLASYPAAWPDIWAWPDPEGFTRFELAVHAEVKAGAITAGSFVDLGISALMRQDWEQAQKIFDHVRKELPGTPFDTAAFGARFHAELDAMGEEEIIGGLAPVRRLRQPDFAGPVLYLASDPKYFLRFTVPFLHALDEKTPGIEVQVHILDGDEEEWRAVLQAAESLSNIRLGLSVEASGVRQKNHDQARFYYHAVRFIRFYQELKRSNVPLWLLDVDVQLLKDPRAGFAKLVGHDIAFAGNWYVLQPVLKLWACCVGIAPTPAGIAFLRRVAAYISFWNRRGKYVWGTDQLALLSCYAHHVDRGIAPRTLFLQPDFVGTMGETTGALRFLGGLKKYRDDPSA